jgi:hypothetical protein
VLHGIITREEAVGGTVGLCTLLSRFIYRLVSNDAYLLHRAHWTFFRICLLSVVQRSLELYEHVWLEHRGLGGRKTATHQRIWWPQVKGWRALASFACCLWKERLKKNGGDLSLPLTRKRKKAETHLKERLAARASA